MAESLIDRVGHEPVRLLKAHRLEMLVAAALLIGFFAIYYIVAQSYRALPGYDEHINILFGADHRDALRGWIGNHKGSHPIVLLIVMPLGELLESFSTDYAEGMMTYAAGLGALTVTMLFLLLRGLVGHTAMALAVTVFFGFSMSQLVFAAIPDTYELSALLLLPTYGLTLICLRHGKLYLPCWIAAGVVSFGITITNVAQTAICLAVVLFTIPHRRRILSYAVFLVAVGAIGLALAFVQKLAYPDARIFFMSQTFEHESQYISTLIQRKPVFVVQELAKNFFLFPFIGQTPIATVFEPGERLKLVYYKAALAYGWPVALLVISWLALWLHGVILNLREPQTRRFTLALFLAVAFNLALHAVYGPREIFLYSPHFTIALLLASQGPRAAGGWPIASVWAVLAVLTASNNFAVIVEMLRTYT